MNTDVQTNEGQDITSDQKDNYNNLLYKMGVTEENLQTFIKDLNEYIKLRKKLDKETLSDNDFRQVEQQHYLNKQKIEELQEKSRILIDAKMLLATISGHVNNEEFIQLKNDAKIAWQVYEEAKDNNKHQKDSLNNNSSQSNTSLISKLKGEITKRKQDKLDRETAERYQEYKRKNIRYSEALYKIITLVKGSQRGELITTLSNIDGNISSFSQFANYVQDNIDNNNSRYMFLQFNEAIARQLKEIGQELNMFLNGISKFEEMYEIQDSLRTKPSTVIGRSRLTIEEQKQYLEIVFSYPSLETIDLEILESIAMEPDKIKIKNDNSARKVKTKGGNKSE